jgi:predicted RNA-binding protein
VSNDQLAAIIAHARSERRLRQLIEVFAATDPVVADVLYQLDRRLVDVRSPRSIPDPVIPLTGWQSYGRPEVQRLATAVDALPRSARTHAVILPCARRRPYDRSRTHQRIWRALQSEEIRREDVDAVVVSSVGIVPELLWSDPVALAYDSGVPDIYRVLRLMRSFFRRNPYEVVVDCLEFAPYSDCLAVVSREGIIGRVVPGPKRRVRRVGTP